MKIRRAEIKDARAIAQINVDTWRDAYKGLIDDAILAERKVDDKRLAGWDEKIANPEYVMLVCEEKEIIGYLWAGPARDEREVKNEVYALYVKTTEQRHGAGRELIKNYEQIINNEGFYLYMLKKNAKAAAFYTAMGGVPAPQYDRKLVIHEQELDEVCYIFK